MKFKDTPDHVKGRSLFLDDLPEPSDCCHLALVTSPVAHGKLYSIDTSNALSVPGVLSVISANDIPGDNEIGTMIYDEPLLAESELHFLGQPVAIVAARTPHLARKAADMLELDYTPFDPVLSPRVAAHKGRFIAPSRTLVMGSIDEIWSQCHTIVQGSCQTGGQEHLYLETQSAMAICDEKNGITLYSSTQSPTAVQRVTARVLGLAMHQVQVEVKRLGGGFGGKEDQATIYAVCCALAANLLKKPAKLVLERHEDMRFTGKRHPYESDFKMGLDKTGRILAYEVQYFQDAGASADLSTAVLERTLYHATNTYYVPNVRVTGHSCRTNRVPNTAYRGFGGPQALFVIESAIDKASRLLKIPAHEIQRINMIESGQRLPYGQIMHDAHGIRAFDQALKQYDYTDRLKAVAEFNANSVWFKRGVAVMPICFGISFTSTFLNQAGALLHIYSDGSVSISTGAVEMGQGVNAKLRQIASTTLGIDTGLVNVQATSTRTVANTSPTAASAAADLNGMAVKLASEALKARLLDLASGQLHCPVHQVDIADGVVLMNGEPTLFTWHKLIQKAYLSRCNLSAQAHYATPEIYFDKNIEKGRPFAYYVFGTAIIQASVDILRGTAGIDSVQMVHDAGRSLNQLIDQGQAEGALMQGLGWMTMEELCYDEEGRLLTDSLTTYKIPDIHFLPDNIEISFLEDADNPHAVLQSKGIGEPPFLYGIGAYFAIINALRAAKPDLHVDYTAPLTHQRILKLLES